MIRLSLLKMCVAIFYINSLIGFFDIYELDKQNAGKILVKQEVIDANYQLMKDVHELFEFYGIEYWVQGGMLVGIERNGGMLPWDDDLDINVSYKDLCRILGLKSVFEKLGYYVKFCPSLIIKIGKKGKCLVDIFPVKRSGRQITYIDHWWKREGKPLYVYEHELYPLKLYQFGPLQLWGPHNPFAYLRCGFGDDYMNRIVIYNHKVKTKHECRFDEVALEFQTHVVPSEPLEDRVVALNLKKPKSKA